MAASEFHNVCEAIGQLEDCDNNVKTKLIDILSKWKESRGFRLEKCNKEFLHILLRMFLLNDTTVSTQVLNKLNILF